MQLKISIAEANKKVATARGDSASAVIQAKGQAIANQKLEEALSPLLIDKMWIEHWSGQVPTYMLGSNSATYFGLPSATK